MLLSKLIRNRGLMIIQLTLYSQADHPKHYDRHSKCRNGPAPNLSLETAIDKRHEKHRNGNQPWNHDNADHYSRTFPELKPLEHRQVVPLGPGEKPGIRGIRKWTKSHWTQIGEPAED